MKYLKVLLVILITIPTLIILQSPYIQAQRAELPSQLHAGWNLIAIPYFEGEVSAKDLFGVENPVVYTWDAEHCKYIAVDVLKAGKGYWVYVSEPAAIHLKPQVRLLVDRDYFNEVLNLINKANVSIHIAMFSMKYDPDDSDDPANDFINALVAAAERGVQVTVVLDDYPRWNYGTADYLKSHGVDVHIFTLRETMHAKVVVVDSKIVVFGSHNWSESALVYNHEVSIFIRSLTFAKELASYIENLAEMVS